MLDCVIFDMDGTLLDTERISVDAWQAANRKFGYEIPADFIISYFGTTRDKIDQLYRDTYGPDFPIEQIRAERMELGRQYFLEHPVPVKPGAAELLQHLRERNVVTALASSTFHTQVEEQLRRAGLRDLLDIVVGGDMVSRSKPEPDIFLLALEKANARAAYSLVVEDTENGARAGIAAGCPTVIVPDLRQPGQEVRDRLFACCPSLLDLIPLVDQLLDGSLEP